MATEDYDEPFGWWGWHWQPPVPLSVVQLIEARSFDAPLMALLWSLCAPGVDHCGGRAADGR